MQRKFIYFINPISGTKDKEKALQIIRERTTKAGIPFEILHTNPQGNYDYLQEKIEAQQVTDIIVCGGDGTVNQVAAALKNIDIPIGIVPMGSGNGLALTAGISKNIHKALNIIFNGKAALVDGFTINGKFSCMLCGLGFDAQVAHDFAAQQKRGLKTYVEQTIKNFRKAPTYTFILRIADTIIQTEAFFISIANSNQFGNNVKIAPKASLSDGLLDIVVVNKMSKAKLLYSIGKQLFFGSVTDAAQHKKFKKEDIFYYQTKKLIIENIDGAPLHIDGDPANTAAKFEIEIVENAFKLLQPLH